MSNTPIHGSDVQETPDWWMASDQRWYPPELHPAYQPPAAPAPPPEPEPEPVAPAAAEVAEAAPAAAADPPRTVSSLASPSGDRSSGSPASLSERLREAADQVEEDIADGAPAAVVEADEDALADAADAMGAAASTAGADATMDAGSIADGLAESGDDAASSIADQIGEAPPAQPPWVPVVEAGAAAGAPPMVPPAAPPTVPPAAPAVPPMPAMPASPQTVIVQPGQLPPSAPPSGPPVAPVAPAAPLGETIAGPGGITYTAAAEPTPAADQFPTVAAAPPPAFDPGQVVAGDGEPAKSPIAGTVALIGGAVAIAGSLLQWGKGSVQGFGGVEKVTIEVAGFDSNGLITVIAGAALLICGLLFFVGTPKQLNWAIGAFIAGGVIVGAVVFSVIDISDLSSRYATQWQVDPRAAAGDVVETKPDIGLWLAGAGGVLGVVAAPFVNRDE